MARAVPSARFGQWLGCCLLVILLSVWAGAARAASQVSAPIPSQPPAQALVEFAHQTGLQLLYESKLATQRQSHEAAAGLSPTDALAVLLQGTGLNFQFLNPKTIRIYEPVAGAPAVRPSASEVPKPRVETAAHRVDALDEILVTGTRRAEHLSDLEDVQGIPASVSIVSGAALESEKAVQISDYTVNLPGVNVVGGGAPGASGVVIRSISPLVLATAVAFYLDEVPIGASGRWGYAGGAALDLPPYDLERLEVQRGPQGTFGGAGAEIGSIKYVVHAPDANEYAARVGADVSTIHGASEPGQSVRAMVNAPIIDNLLAVRATAYDSYTPGYINNAYSGAKDINVLRQYGGRLAALWRPAESLSLNFMAFYNRIDQNSQSEVLSPTLVNVPGTGDAYLVSGRGSYGDLSDSRAFLSPFTKSLDTYSATLRWNPGFADFVSVTGWSRSHEHYVEDYSPIVGTDFPVLSGGAVPAGLAKLVEDVYLDKVTQELRIASPSRRRLDWVFGAFYTRERLDQRWVENAFDDSYRPIAAFAPYLGLLSRPSAFSEIAVFADLTWSFSDPFEIVAGIRSAADKQDFNNVLAGTLGQQDFAGQERDEATTFTTSARYRIVPTVMVYGRVATGIQPDSIFVPAPGYPNSQKGETATNYEVGVKSSYLEHRALLDLTLFHLNRARLLAIVYESGVFHAAADGGNAAARGLELSSSYTPLRGLTFGYNVAYTQCAFTNIDPTTPYQLMGFQLENVPKWDMSVTVDYDWALTDVWHAHAGGDFRSVGKEWAGYVQSRSLGGYPTTQLPSYTVLDLNAAVARGPLSVKLFARNLADKRAYLDSNVIVNYNNAPVQAENYILQPRTIGVGLDWIF